MPNNTVKNVINYAEMTMKIESNKRLTLVHGEIKLDESKTLEDYGIKDDSILVML